MSAGLLVVDDGTGVDAADADEAEADTGTEAGWES